MNEENEMERDPNNWKLGIFYFNPKDKRVFVLKRVPAMGFTLNFGNPLSILALSAIVIFVILVSKK